MHNERKIKRSVWGDDMMRWYELSYKFYSMFGRVIWYVTNILYHIHQQCTQPLSRLIPFYQYAHYLLWQTSTTFAERQLWRPLLMTNSNDLASAITSTVDSQLLDIIVQLYSEDISRIMKLQIRFVPMNLI